MLTSNRAGIGGILQRVCFGQLCQWTVGYRSKRNSNGKLSVIAWNGKIDRDQLTKIYP
jgi:hypothetical protein